MKKFLLATMIAVAGVSATVPAHADWHGNRGYHGSGYGYRGGWVAPLIGGAIIGGIIANQYRPYYPPPAPVYVDPAYPQPVYPGQTVCRPVQTIDQYGNTYWTQQCWVQQ